MTDPLERYYLGQPVRCYEFRKVLQHSYLCRMIQSIKQCQKNQLGLTLNLKGMCYQEGWSFSKNLNKALQYYQQASDLDCPQAMRNLAWFYFDGIGGVQKDVSKAINLLEEASNQPFQYALAMTDLAGCYFDGKGVPQDREKAINLYQQAINLNDFYAITYLALCYLDGSGIRQDYSIAIQLLRIACDHGVPNAMAHLGICYQKGLGVSQNLEQAIRLFRKGCILNDPFAMTCYALLCHDGIEVPQDQIMSIQLLKRASDLGEPEAMMFLALCYQLGQGVSIDLTKAIQLWQKLDDKDYGPALFRLGLCYAMGRGVSRDRIKTIELWTRAVHCSQLDGNLDVDCLDLFHLIKAEQSRDQLRLWRLAKKAKIPGVKNEVPATPTQTDQ